MEASQVFKKYSNYRSSQVIAIGEVIFSEGFLEKDIENIVLNYKEAEELKNHIMENDLEMLSLTKVFDKDMEVKIDKTSNSIKVFVEDINRLEGTYEAIEVVTLICLILYREYRKFDRDISIGNIKVVKDISRDKKELYTDGVLGETIFVGKSEVKEREFSHGEELMVLSLESIYRVEDTLSIEIERGSLNEDITTKGILLYEIPVGTRIVVGETIQEVTGICEIEFSGNGITESLYGIDTKVIKAGQVNVGDNIEII